MTVDVLGPDLGTMGSLEVLDIICTNIYQLARKAYFSGCETYR